MMGAGYNIQPAKLGPGENIKHAFNPYVNNMGTTLGTNLISFQIFFNTYC